MNIGRQNLSVINIGRSRIHVLIDSKNWGDESLDVVVAEVVESEPEKKAEKIQKTAPVVAETIEEISPVADADEEEKNEDGSPVVKPKKRGRIKSFSPKKRK